MSDENTIELKLLGTGTSTGVPTISCTCPTCISLDPKDKRLRCSALITYKDKNIIIDTGPDFRQQFLKYGIDNLEAVIYTHHHFDHIGGFDDIRGINFTSRKALPIYLNSETLENLSRIFSYAFRNENETGGGIPMVEVNMISDGEFQVNGLKITILPLLHGTLDVLGFRIGDIAYCTDTNYIPNSTLELMKDLDVLILDGLRPKTHKTHFNIEQAIEQASKINAKQTYLTHIAHQVKHSEVEITLPEGINLAYDGLTIRGKNIMVRISVDYLGDLYCNVVHTPSGNSFKTNAPVDNKGKGDYISPTDLVAASIASCVSTIMGIKAQDKGIDIAGMNITASKIMTEIPFRRIEKLILDITFPHELNEEDYKLLSNVVKTCPVTRSLTAEINLEYNFNFAE